MVMQRFTDNSVADKARDGMTDPNTEKEVSAIFAELDAWVAANGIQVERSLPALITGQAFSA